MNNKLIFDLTLRLTQALDQNYDVVNMDAVLGVISALEGATITKEQLETTRLAKHINQLRRRNKSNILAIRAKNLLKKWREMVGITSQPQLENVSSATQQAHPTQLQVSKPPFSSASQPTSPYGNQLLGDNFDNSLSSIGGGNEFSSKTEMIGNIGNADFTFKKTVTDELDAAICHRSNGAIGDSQIQLMKNTNRNLKNNSQSQAKVKHPTSFKNLIKGINANISKQSSLTLSPTLTTSHTAGDDSHKEENVKPILMSCTIENDDNQSQLSNVCSTQTKILSPQTDKLSKRKDRDSPVLGTFMEQSNSPIRFEKKTRENEPSPQIDHNQVAMSTINLNDTNSNSSFANTLCEVAEDGSHLGLIVSSSTRAKADKEVDRTDLPESCQFQPNIDESSRIAFPISCIEEYLSLSNTSMSIFPSQQSVATEENKRKYPNSMGSTENELLNSVDQSAEVLGNDLTFAGKFKQSNSLAGIDIGPSSNYFSNGGEIISATSSEFPCGNLKLTLSNSKDSVIASGTVSTSTFLPFSHNSNDSTSDSRTSQLDLIDVVNQDSQSVITIDDLRQQSSNEKIKIPRDTENVQEMQGQKYIKDNSIFNNNNTMKPFTKEQPKVLSSFTPTRQQKIKNPALTSLSGQNNTVANVLSPIAEQKVPKKRGRKKGSKGVDSVLAQSAGLNTQFFIGPSLGLSKKVKTTIELLADIQNRKLGSATSSPTLMNMNWFGNSRPSSSCSEPSLHSPRTSDACSTNATISTAARSTPEKNISNNADGLYESDSDSNTSEPSLDGAKVPTTDALINKSRTKIIANDFNAEKQINCPQSTIEQQIKDLMMLLPPINLEKVDWEIYDDIPCTCVVREVPVKNENSSEKTKRSEEVNLNFVDNLQCNKFKENDCHENAEQPVFSIDVNSLAQQMRSPKDDPWLQKIRHPQSAPVSAVNSPDVPSKDQKPVKSIFDLDFDDENDPLLSFVEAVNITKKSRDCPAVKSNDESVREENSPTLQKTVENGDLSESNLSEEIEKSNPSVQTIHQLLQQQADDIEVSTMLSNFPVYEAIEDPNCQAKLRYEIETNQITQFHINAFHNCFIPNVNGNWDHSTPSKLNEGIVCHENDMLYTNVVPKYGCFAVDRIPKDLSHIKFNQDFKPRITKKIAKQSEIFLGVANIRRNKRLQLRNRKHKRKTSTNRRKRIKNSTTATKITPRETRDDRSIIVATTQDSDDNNLAHGNSLNVTECDHNEQFIISDCNRINHSDILINNIDFDTNSSENPLAPHKSEVQFKSDSTAVKKINGNIRNLMNNNTILHCTDGNRNHITEITRIVNNNHNSHESDRNANDELVTSRRSSSCSNSSLKQNQKSINMKLRRRLQLEKEKQRQKRKYSPTITEVLDFDDERIENQTIYPYIKRIKILNSEVRQSINSVTDNNYANDDDDSSDRHLQFENGIITEEGYVDHNHREVEDEYDEIADDEDDDEDETEEPYGDYHEVITRDITSSKNGNNHIVLTIKKTPSKTNSPSSSSMSPAPTLTISGKQSNSPTGSLTVDGSCEPKIYTACNYRENDKIKNLKALERNITIRTADLMEKTDFLLPEPSDIAIYRFDMSDNNESGGGNEDDDNDDKKSNTGKNNAIESIDDECIEDDEKEENADSVLNNEDNTDIKETDICRANLSESIKLAKGRIRRLELEFTLSRSIADAQKVHRKLFFHDELRTSIGSKILEISSCSSSSDSSDSDTNTSDDSTLSSSSYEGLEGMKSKLMLKRRTKKNVAPKKKEAAGDGGGPPSSSSSSSSDSSSSSSSFRTFTSWSTTSSSSSDDEKLEKAQTLPSTIKNNESLDKKDDLELPVGNNYLLRSFNHIYVSTEERLRQQQQVKQLNEVHHSEIINNGYITISGNGLAENPTSNLLPSSLLNSDNCDAHTYYTNNNQNFNISTFNSAYNITSSSHLSANNERIEPPKSLSSISSSLLSVVPSSSIQQQQQPQTIEQTLICAEAVSTEALGTETLGTEASSSGVLSTEALSMEPSVQGEPAFVQKSAGDEIEACKGESTNQDINTDNKNENTDSQLLKTAEQNEDLVAFEEYRTGLRKVDEDVDDEEGNNCARTQQFKEWHEVLQLRSYNDELLTVLPYVVIE